LKRYSSLWITSRVPCHVCLGTATTDASYGDAVGEYHYFSASLPRMCTATSEHRLH
jgi:hypothetical protein